ncbi:uncharacterized protein LOC125897772 [Epinephelus fuscoguttatus]|uniref:uncharacterized protein LOC125897772 n=1 Tax=Epinephelus fuscoguttatus TaxID=293821 RepID=UPI0020D06465|nr:uncharacterized protein LOC125897772 [Epinephelus fuscoguttatus]
MEKRTNRRGYPEQFVQKQHLKLNDLKEKACNKYLSKEDIPEYPRPEFHVSHLKHDTDRDGLNGIWTDNGFKSPYEGPLVWWSLAVTPDDMESAERRLLEETYPDRTEEQTQMQQSFLEKFATSPAFKKTSRLGSFRFTFPLEEVLSAYSQQFCSGAQPVMRVFETILYPKEVVYTVLVHSPANQEFSDYPLLTDDPDAVCAYRDGRFIWRPEAMSETHSYELIRRPAEKQMEAQKVAYHQFYVWDNVAIALHVEEQVLKFDTGRLRENLKFCSAGKVVFTPRYNFLSFPRAKEIVEEMWPGCPPLEEDKEPNSENE